MARKGVVSPFPRPRRRKSRHTAAREARHSSRLLLGTPTEEEILALVRRGVERFILNRATVEDFYTIMREVSGKGGKYSHQLTKAVFSKIVKEAARKRRTRRST